MRQSVCEELNMFIRRVWNLIQYETKGLWPSKHVFWGVLNLTQYETKGLWKDKHVLLKNVKFNTVWDKWFVTRLTCSFEECYIWHSMRQRVCEQLNMFFRKVLNLTQYERKGLWPGKHVLLKSVTFYTVLDKGFVRN